jgi:hypothetical protein
MTPPPSTLTPPTTTEAQPTTVGGNATLPPQTAAPTPAPPVTPAPPPEQQLLLVAELRMPAECRSTTKDVPFIPVQQCFTIVLTECFPWIMGGKQIGFFQYTEVDPKTSTTNITFFLVYPESQRLNYKLTKRVLDEYPDSNCTGDGLASIRASASDTAATNAPEETISPVGVGFALFLIFAVMVAFFGFILYKKRQIDNAKLVRNTVRLIEEHDGDELACVYTRTKQEEERAALEEAARRQDEARQSEQNRNGEGLEIPHVTADSADTSMVEVDDIVVAPPPAQLPVAIDLATL